MEESKFENSTNTRPRYFNQLEAVFNASSDGIWVTNRDCVVINVNAAAERLNDIKAKDVIGRSLFDIVGEGIIEECATPKVIETKQPVTLFSFQKKTGRSILVTATPVFDNNGNVDLVITNERDFTQLNALKEELDQNREITDKFRDKLAEISQLEFSKNKFICESESMRELLNVCIKVAKMEASNILLLGESGSGKGLLAKFIHNNSTRKNKPFININCAALPTSLLEAELFGYEKGAFTGADEKGKAGLFELAHTGTLLLDEIGDLSPVLQAKLLKYLDDHEIMRLGSVKSKKIDCMLLSATNRNLNALVQKQKFREDLFFRLNTFSIKIPPLRDRKEDIFELANYYLEQNNKKYNTRCRISNKAMDVLQSYSFPGNVRELKNIIKKAVVLNDGQFIDDVIYESFQPAENKFKFAASSEKEKVQKSFSRLSDQLNALERTIVSKTIKQFKSTRKAAKHLGISQTSIMRKKKKYGIS